MSGRVLRLLAFLRDLAGAGPAPEGIAREYVRRLTTGDLTGAAALLSAAAREAVLRDGLRGGAGLGLLGMGESRIDPLETCLRGDDRASVILRVGAPPRSLVRRIELVREERRWRVRPPVGGRLTVDAHPWGAVFVDGAPVRGSRRDSGIVIDGKRVAITPVVDLELSAGWHQVRVDHIHLADGSVRMRAVREVEVPAGGTAALVMRLEPVHA